MAGHHTAKLDPLGINSADLNEETPPALQLAKYSFGKLDRLCSRLFVSTFWYHTHRLNFGIWRANTPAIKSTNNLGKCCGLWEECCDIACMRMGVLLECVGWKFKSLASKDAWAILSLNLNLPQKGWKVSCTFVWHQKSYVMSLDLGANSDDAKCGVMLP